MIFNYISFPIFIISFAIGIFFVYLWGPDKKIIYVYPTPENVDKILFKDNADNCFYFEETEIECPSNNSFLSEVPIQM